MAEPDDILDADYINSLQLPLWFRGYRVVRIDVETGRFAIDANGLMCGRALWDIRRGDLRDCFGHEVHEGDLYLDEAHWVTRVPPDDEEVPAGGNP